MANTMVEPLTTQPNNVLTQNCIFYSHWQQKHFHNICTFSPPPYPTPPSPPCPTPPPPHYPPPPSPPFTSHPQPELSEKDSQPEKEDC